MSTRPLPPPPIVPDDPGPWSVVSHVRQTLAHRPDRRRAPTPTGLLIASPPNVDVPIAGLDPDAALAGAGRIRLVAAAREAARWLSVDDDGAALVGISPGVRRRWTLPDLRLQDEQRPDEDPAAGLPDPLPVAELATADLDAAVHAPGGEVAALAVTTGRAPALALLRVADRGLVRWIAGAHAGAWTPDGAALVVGGDWGVALAVPAG
jgi:hypothetical protein